MVQNRVNTLLSSISKMMENTITMLPTTATVTKTAKFSILSPPSTIFGFSSGGKDEIVLENDQKHPVIDVDDEKSEKLAQDQFALLYTKYPTSNVAIVSLQERKLLGSSFGKVSDKKPVTIDKSIVIDTMYDEIKLTQDLEYLSKATSATSLVYGEINDVDSMINTFRLLKEYHAFPIPNTQGRDIVFYDLGSGTGRVVMAVALLGYATRCIGIEIQSSLYQTSKLVQQGYETLLQTQSFYTPLANPPTIVFHHGSIIDPAYIEQWKEADIIFINCTCFDDDLMDQLFAVIQTMRPGCLIILLTVNIPVAVNCELLFEFRQQMSWGMADYFLYKKL